MSMNEREREGWGREKRVVGRDRGRRKVREGGGGAEAEKEGGGEINRNGESVNIFARCFVNQSLLPK